MATNETKRYLEKVKVRLPAVNQIETHPFNQQVEAQQFMQENNVQIES